MASYVVPQVEIHQLFSEIPVSLTQNQVPFIFGPNYHLQRYENTEERAGTYAGTYNGESSSKSWTYPSALAPENIDLDYVKVFVEDTMVELQSNVTIAKTGTEATAKVTMAYADPFSATTDLVGKYLKFTYTKDSTPTTVTYEIVGIDTATTTSTVKGVILGNEIPAGATITTGSICEYHASAEVPREQISDSNKVNFLWTASASGVAVSHQFETAPLDTSFGTHGLVLSGDVYITYREWIDNNADSIHTLTGATSVAEALGPVTPDNPLAMAVYNCALNAGGQEVRYMALPGPEKVKDNWSKVLQQAELTREVYFLVPVTQDLEVIEKVRSHVGKMSNGHDDDFPTNTYAYKRWRIAFISYQPDKMDPIYNISNRGYDYHAKSVAGAPTGSTYIQFFSDASTPEADVDFIKHVKSGDYLYLNLARTEWGKVVPLKYKITKVVNKNTVSITGTISQTLVTAAIYHENTKQEMAEAIRDQSSYFASRRIYNVFPGVFYGSGMTQTGEFAAACVAGLVSSCLPQQPVTNMELSGISDIPQVYQDYTFDQLNTMASGGTFIVMQDMPNDEVYVRHQISTSFEDNNLNTAELSITKNLDSISYYFDDLLTPYIGKYNITPELLTAVRSAVETGITQLSASSYGLYGPQLIANGTEILLLEQDAVLKDHINCNIQLNMPYPFNRMILKLFV